MYQDDLVTQLYEKFLFRVIEYRPPAIFKSPINMKLNKKNIIKKQTVEVEG